MDSQIHNQDCLELLKTIPNETVQLVLTSPPYNIGKSYETVSTIPQYLEHQRNVLQECHRILKPSGSCCWQVGNYIEASEIIPLDILLYPQFKELEFKLRNRIIWHFNHGLHCQKRFSGRYETIMWFTKSDSYIFNLDAVRVPQLYPQKKHFKGPKVGQLSCNPLGKNPSDHWDIPNVKHNHIEKTEHPCQFPIELAERIILALSNELDIVVDPFVGSGTTVIAAELLNRIGLGSDLSDQYCEIARQRLFKAQKGCLKTRPMNTPIGQPSKPQPSTFSFYDTLKGT